MVTAAALRPSLVRIQTADRRVVGAGFLVGERHILTCARVVLKALALRPGVEQQPAGILDIDFPFVMGTPQNRAQVISWGPAHNTEMDVAGLELEAASPSGSAPVRLVRARTLWGHTCCTFGFPAGLDDGIWVTGCLGDRLGNEWIQIEGLRIPDAQTQMGFCGTPVWDEQLDSVVGMLITADQRSDSNAAFMIPTATLIAAWPLLAPRSLDADTDAAFLHEQISMLRTLQEQTRTPSRFEARISELRNNLQNWDQRVERQQQRIAQGLALEKARRVLVVLEEQAAGYTFLTIPAHLQIDLEDKRREVAALEATLASLQPGEQWRAKSPSGARVLTGGKRPPDVSLYFQDRNAEQRRLGALLAEPSTRLVSIIGHGGMGKTALASKVLRDLESLCWPHTDEEIPLQGIVYLSARTTGISLERLYNDCARVLGEECEHELAQLWMNPKATLQEKVDRLLETLSEGCYVILLDSIDDLIDENGRFIDQFLQLFFDHRLSSGDGARLLVTSRRMLALDPEVQRFDKQVPLNKGLPLEAGIALLRDLDPNGAFGLRDAPVETLTKAVKLAHGVPRALEVLAGILANDPFASLDDVLQEFYTKEDVVHKLIEENYRRLDRNARWVIEALAVFRRPVQPLAVDYLLEPFAPGLNVPDIIMRLEKTNIVSVDRRTKEITLHPIDQDYAYSQLPTTSQSSAVYTLAQLESRAADFYARICKPAAQWQSIDDITPQLAQFEHCLRAREFDRAVALLESIDGALCLWGYFIQLRELRERLGPELLTPGSRSDNLRGLSKVYVLLGHAEDAIALGKEALNIARAEEDAPRELVCLESLASVYRSLNSVHAAIGLYKEALNIARQIRDQRRVWIITGNQGFAHQVIDEITRAHELTQQALAAMWAAEDHHYRARFLSNLGFARHMLGRLGEAEDFHQQALTIAQNKQYRDLEAMCRGHLGFVQRDRLALQPALDNLQEALSICQSIGNRREESNVLYRLGSVHHTQREFAKAIDCFIESQRISREIGNDFGEAYRLDGLGWTYLATGDWERAENCLLDAHQRGALGWPTFRVPLALGILHLHAEDGVGAQSCFNLTADNARATLAHTPRFFKARYALGAALLGLGLTALNTATREAFFTQAHETYAQAREHCAGPGVLADAHWELTQIETAGKYEFRALHTLLAASDGPRSAIS